MQRTALSDRFTVIAIAVIAYAGVNIGHEIIGHCGMAALVSAKCRLLSSTNIPLTVMPPTWKYNIIVMAGCAANWTIGLTCLGLLRTLRTNQPALRYFVWLLMCVNLLLPSTYMTVAPIIKFGDSYILISGLHWQFVWRSALVLSGAAICWLAFRVCRAELGKLIGVGGLAARSIAWELVLPAYVAGGIVTITSGLFSQLEFRWAQLEAAGGTFGLTFWLLLLPFGIPEPPRSEQPPFRVPRSVGWIVAGALSALIFIGVLGPGISL
jgi:hypothetical protein